ncbi:hypothetical protein L1887_38268 [Cichorium endivia]|nr:hypothetical protein L1887_38268 [Cichorium endivia]
MNLEELQQHTGFKSPPGDCPKKQDEAKANRDGQPFMFRNFTDIPPKLDWRTKNAVGPVKNQQGCGSCYAFAGVEAVEGLHAIKNKQLVELSPKELVDCAKVGGCDGGYFTACYEYIAKNGGLTTMKNYPYVPKVEPCNLQKEKDIAVEVHGYENMPSPGIEEDMYKVIANQPLACCMEWNENVSAYKEGVFDGDCGPKIQHAISVVGYDQTPDGQKYWIIKNSWGEGWGEKGYMRLARDTGGEGRCKIAHWCAYPTLEDTGTKHKDEDIIERTDAMVKNRRGMAEVDVRREEGVAVVAEVEE